MNKMVTVNIAVVSRGPVFIWYHILGRILGYTVTMVVMKMLERNNIVTVNMFGYQIPRGPVFISIRNTPRPSPSLRIVIFGDGNSRVVPIVCIPCV
jgi:hypothetical protein